MGTEIHLYLGRYQIDWGKNDNFANHSALFQMQDLQTEVQDYGYTEEVMTEGFSKPLGEMIGRLELLGHNLAAVRSEFKRGEDEYGDVLNRPFSFNKLLALAKDIDIHKVTGEWSKPENPLSVPKTLTDKMGGPTGRFDSYPDFWDLELLFAGLSPYSILRLLAENPANLDVPVIWPFGETVSSGWAERDDFLPRSLPVASILIVTEGSSDSKILQKALSLLRPQYAEFFHFVDMEEGYPFTGTGNLFRFCQGLVSIRIQNQVLILYDNDTEGVSNYEATRKLSLPNNMVAAKLPDLKALNKMDAVGPHGSRKANINGAAAAIECYLDLNYKTAKPPVIRWSAYNKGLDRYQGALENKTGYMKTFLNLRKAEASYDFTKIEAVLDHIYGLCVDMAARQGWHWGKGE